MDDVPPGYWKTLLELAASVTDDDTREASRPSTSGVDGSNQAWLEEVMADLVKRTDPSKQLSIALATLNILQKVENLTDEVLNRIEEVANALIDLLSFADLTQKFAAEKGFELVTHFMTPAYPARIQTVFGDALLTLADNNPLAQEAISNYGLLEALMEAALDPSREKIVRLKILGVICASVGSHEPSLDRFLEFHGKEMLSKLYQDEDIDIALKAARITCTIAFTYCDSVEIMEKLISVVYEGYTSSMQRASDKGANEIKYMKEFLRNENMKSFIFPDHIRESLAEDDDVKGGANSREDVDSKEVENPKDEIEHVTASLNKM